jgi:hypothetical protein
LAILAGQFEKPRRLEQSCSKMCRHQSRPALSTRRDKKNQKGRKMVAASKANARLLRKVAETYNWLDLQIRKNSTLAGVCTACGKCCDFKGFDHQLFITTPELIYLAANVGAENINPPHVWRIKPMTTNTFLG